MLANPNNVNYVHAHSGDTPLHQACKQGWLDVVKLMIETYGCDSNVKNKSHRSPLDYAKRCGKVDVFSYLQRINSSLYWACAQGNKHLVLKLINPDNVNCVHPDFGDTPLHRACRRGCLNIVKLLIERYGCDPNVTTKSNQSVLHYACLYGNIDIVEYLINEQHMNPLLRDNVDQSEPLDFSLNNDKTDIAVYICQHCISSDEMLNPNRIKTTINLTKYILRANPSNLKWRTADGKNIFQLVGSSKTCISHIPSAVMLEILNSLNTDIITVAVKPDWKTSDGDNILELACQSAIFLSQTHSGLILKWLGDTTVNQVKISIPDSKTADGDTLIQLVCQSEIYISHISTAVLTEWLSDTTRIQNLTEIITPEWKTADGDTLLQLVCQTESILPRISSTILTKWLNDPTTTFDPIIVTAIPDLRTADGTTLFELICQSEKCLIQVSSIIFLKWLRNIPLESVVISIPDCKTADGYTLLQLILQSEMSMSQTSSTVLLKLLGDSRDIPINQMRMAHPNWKTLDGVQFLYALYQSKVDNINIIELTQHYILKDCFNPDNTTIDNQGNTALHIACQANKLALVSYLIEQVHYDPNVKNKMGNTALHIACQANKLAVVSYLIDQAHCDPNIRNEKGYLPLDMTANPQVISCLCQHNHIAVYSKTVVEWMNRDLLIFDATMLLILKSLIENHRFETKDGSTLLHVLCTHIIFRANKEKFVDFLLTEGHCDPNCSDSNGKMPLQLTSSPRIMIKLLEHDAKMTADVVFKLTTSSKTDFTVNEILSLSARKGAILCPNELNSDGYTALHLACKANNFTRVNILLSEAHCDPNVKRYHRSNRETPLYVTSDSKIMTKLIEHGAKVTADVVFKLITSNKMDSEINEILSLSIRKQAMLWNPNELNSDGYTALHLACKTNIPTRVNILLSEAHCDPNVKSNNEEVALQMTTNPDIIKDLIRHGAKTSIMYESYQYSLRTNKPVQPPVKVFIVGNPSVGKSTLTAALKKKIGIIARIFSGKVSGVDQKTVGIVPHDLESETFGRITLYDFAGHREFYSGHAALLQTAIQSTPPVFLLVVKICEDGDGIIKNILYWISFLENQCASVSCKPHIILVGSHADTLKGINSKDKIKTIIDSLDTKCFTNMEYIGFVAMNCQYHESAGMSDLRHLLIKSCERLRIHEPITFNAHCFLVFLIDTFMNQMAITIKTISETIENQQSKNGVLEFLPESIETLYKICLELNDRGHILLLKNRSAIENSYIVIDKEFLLSRLSGTVFAPEGFKQYKKLSTNTGVVPLSKIAETFPDQDLNILIGFLTHLEFCHEISDQALHQLISEQYSHVSGECYYLFPGLISVKADDTVWQMESVYIYDYSFGWILKCIHLENFFSPRFLQVLILRLVFSFALETSREDPNRSIGIHRNCYIWKNGISWGSVFAMQTLVEVSSDNKSVLLLARFKEDDLLQCVHHRSEVISTILQCKEQFCPRVQTTELFLDSCSPHQYPLNLSNESNICTLQNLATAVVSDSKSRRVVIQCNTVPAKNYLSFEPYLEMKLSTIQELRDETNEKKVISETFLSKLIQKSSDELSSLIKTLTGSSTNSISEGQLYRDLLRWRDSDKTKQKTYEELRQKVDQYSVFAGRNVLVSYCFECPWIIIIYMDFK